MGLAAKFTKRRGAETIDVALALGTATRAEAASQAGLVLALFGPSGCGKTTTLRCVAGLEDPEHGTIKCNEETWFDATSRLSAPPQRRGVGFVTERDTLFPHLTVEQNIAFGLRPWDAIERNRRVEELLRLLRLQGLGSRWPAQLSAGQRQRVSLARALAPRPRLLLLDEPLGALDEPTRLVLRRELRTVLRQLQCPALLVTHDPREALSLADDVAVMLQGRVVQTGAVHDVFAHPQTSAVAAAVGFETIEQGHIERVTDGMATVALGEILVSARVPPGDGTAVFVCVRAADVELQKGHGARGSIDATPSWHTTPTLLGASMNNETATAAPGPRGPGAVPPAPGHQRFRGHVVDVIDEGTMLRITVRAGVLWTALVTRSFFERVRVGPGDCIDVVIATNAVHLVRQ
jgi:molybdate transport system ATP-binding protein